MSKSISVNLKQLRIDVLNYIEKENLSVLRFSIICDVDREVIKGMSKNKSILVCNIFKICRQIGKKIEEYIIDNDK